MVARNAVCTSCGQGGRDAVGVDRVVVEALRFQEDLVAVAVGEAHHLVLDRGAVARPAALDGAGEQRRAVDVGADHRVGGIAWCG